MIARFAQHHRQILAGHLAPDTPEFREELKTITTRIAHSGLSGNDAHARAIARRHQLLNRKAHTSAYPDTLWVLAVLSAVMFVLGFSSRTATRGRVAASPLA